MQQRNRVRHSRLMFWLMLFAPFSPVAAAGANPGPFIVELTWSGDEPAPAPGVTVRLGGRYATSNLKGEAVFDGVPAGEYGLVIEHPGAERLARQADLADGRRQRIKLSLTRVNLVDAAGRVVTAGSASPIAGAKIVIDPVNVAEAAQRQVVLASDWDGTFKILKMAPGQYRASVAAPGCESRAFQITAAAETEPLKFALPLVLESADARIAVRDSAGQAVAGAKVTLAEAFPGGIIAERVADGNGTVAFTNLELAQLNWVGEKNDVAHPRRYVTAHVEASGYVPATIPLTLRRGAQTPVTLVPNKPVEEREPNSNFAQAQSVPLGPPIVFRISEKGDQDHFRFRLPHPGQFTLKLAKDRSLDTSLRLWNADGQTVQAVYKNRNEESSLVKDLLAGEYVISIEGKSGNVSSPEPMRLDVQYAPAVDPLEPNGRFEAARLLEPGNEVRGFIFPVGDRDFFRFKVDRPGHARIVVRDNGTQRAVAIRTPDGTQIGHVGKYPGDGDLDLKTKVRPGWHIAEFTEWDNNACSLKPYTMRLEIIEDDGVTDPPSQGRRP